MKEGGNLVSQLIFRKEIAQHYLIKYGVPAKGAGRPQTFLEGSRVSLDLRYGQTKRFVEEVQKKKKMCR